MDETVCCCGPAQAAPIRRDSGLVLETSGKGVYQALADMLREKRFVFDPVNQLGG
jgi:hypothetical protein